MTLFAMQCVQILDEISSESEMLDVNPSASTNATISKEQQDPFIITGNLSISPKRYSSFCFVLEFLGVLRCL